MHKELYQMDSKGNIKVWLIEVVNYITYTEIVIRTGRHGGNLINNTKKITEGKNVGRANETTHWTQALSEAESKVAAKLREGYVESIKDVQSSDILGSGIPSPMLAQKYDSKGKQSGSKTLQQIGILNKEIVVQPKLDGNRCLIVVTNGNPVMYTRKGDIMPVQLEHILDDVRKNLKPGENIILDGELFSEVIPFNKLNGLIKRVKADAQTVQDRLMIKYHIYDVIQDRGYEHRYHMVVRFATNNNIIGVPAHKVVATEKNIESFYQQFIEEGHEGLMIRQLDMPYESKRTWQLCKMKSFEDAEYKLVGFEEDARGGFVGAFVMENTNGTTFKAGASGQSEMERSEMWKNPNKYIGKMATIEYFDLSEYGVPRFPKFKGLRL